MATWGSIISVLWARQLSTGTFKQLTQGHTAQNRTREILLELQVYFSVLHLTIGTPSAAQFSLKSWVIHRCYGYRCELQGWDGTPDISRDS